MCTKISKLIKVSLIISLPTVGILIQVADSDICFFSLSPETLLLNNSAVCESLEKLHSLHAGCKLFIFIRGPFEKSSRCDNSTPVTSTSLHVLCTRAGPNTREDYARDSLNTISDYTTPALFHTQNVHLTMTICQAGGSSLDRWMSKQL